MANDIIITPVSASIQFSGSANASIKLTVDASGSLSITGNSGSLFSITDNMSGSLMSVNTIAGLPILEVFSDNRVNIGKYAAEAIKIQSGGSDVALGSGSVMFVTSSGRVGIGTTLPVNKLDVVGNISCSAITASNFFGTSSWSSNSLTASSLVIANSYQVANLTASNISASGANVFNKTGFGTSSALINASPMIDVSYGDYSYAGCIRLGADLGVATSRTTNSRKIGIISSFPYNNTSQSIFIIGMDAQLPTVNQLNIGGGTATMASPTLILFHTTSSIQEAGAERMRINGSGNVGIGTTNPVNKLDVAGNISCSVITASLFSGSLSGSVFGTSSWSTNALTASYVSSSNVVGTVTSASYALSSSYAVSSSFATTATTANALNTANNYQVNTLGVGTTTSGTYITDIYSPAIGTLLRIANANATTSSYIVIQRSSSVTDMSIGVAGTANAFFNAGAVTVAGASVIKNDAGVGLVFGVGTTGTIFINSSNNVGFGTNAPINKLDVLGNISASSFTGSHFGTSSYAQTASVAISASYAPGGSLSGGTTNYIPLWTSATTQGISVISQSANLISVSGSLFVSQSITASSISASVLSASNAFVSNALVIGDNIITLNAAPSPLRYTGFEAYDSGSGTLTSLLWDSLNNYFFVSSSDATASRQVILGPVGEANLIANYIPLISGSNNLSSSVMYQSGGYIGVGLTNPVNKFDVLGNISCSVITASLFNGFNFLGGITTISSSTTTTVDLQYAVTQMQLSQSITTFAHSNAKTGTVTWMLATVGAGTSVTITWPTSYKWPGGVAPSLTTTTGKRDVYQFMSYDGASTSTGYVFATVVAQNM